MTLFFVIFFVLVAVNAAMLVYSSLSFRSRRPRETKAISKKPEIKIYPIDLSASNFKKAI